MCSIAGKKGKHTLSIAFRNNIEDIIQRLGVIELPETDETDDVDLFGWAVQTIDRRDTLEDEAVTQKEKAKAEEATEARLQKQLSDLVEAKTEFENQLLSKFTVLLNEKKLKIRNLQRILQTAQVDQKKLADVQSKVGNEDRRHDPRATKRHVEDIGGENDDEESNGFESMDVDNEQDDVNSSASHGFRTPSTESADEELVDDDAVIPKSQLKEKPNEMAATSPLPPPRELPFQSREGRLGKQAIEQKVEEDDEETASEDDEL